MFKKLKRWFWMADAIQTAKALRRAYENIREGYQIGAFPDNGRAEQNIAIYILDAEHHLKGLKAKLMRPDRGIERHLINRSTLFNDGVLKTVVYSNGLRKNQNVRRLMA